MDGQQISNPVVVVVGFDNHVSVDARMRWMNGVPWPVLVVVMVLGVAIGVWLGLRMVQDR